MNSFGQTLVTIFCSVIASSGVWAVVLKYLDRKDSKTQLLVGLAHDRIVHLGMVYIKQGYITRDDYENLYDYLYKPYKELGGNGSAERVMQEVARLEIRPN